MIKNIIFDIGGVIAIHKSEENLRFLSEKYNVDFEAMKKVFKAAEPVHDAGKTTDQEFVSRIMGSVGVKMDADEFFRLHQERFVEPNTKLLGFIKNKLKGKCRLLVLSNNYKRNMDFYSKHPELSVLGELFDRMFISEDYKTVKPDKRFFNIMIKEAGINPEESLFIDDNEKNIKAAKELGFRTIHYKNFDQMKEEMKNIEDMKSLVDF